MRTGGDVGTLIVAVMWANADTDIFLILQRAGKVNFGQVPLSAPRARFFKTICSSGSDTSNSGGPACVLAKDWLRYWFRWLHVGLFVIAVIQDSGDFARAARASLRLGQEEEMADAESVCPPCIGGARYGWGG